MSSPKDFHIDAVYPEPLSRLRRTQGTPINDPSSSSAYRRSVKKPLHRGSSGRFRTQPVTFYEIKEVDEDNIAEPDSETTGSAGAICKSESDLKAKFELFYRSINANNESNSNVNAKNSLPPSKLSTEPMSLNISIEPSTPTLDLDVDLDFDMMEAVSKLPAAMTTSTGTSRHISSTSSPVAIPFNMKSRPSL